MGKHVGTAVCTRYECFAFDNGGCAILTENCKGACKFFKTQEQIEFEREKSAKRLEAIGFGELLQGGADET